MSLEHREPLADALLELGDVEAEPEEADHAEDHERDEEDERELGVRGEEAEVEARQLAERADRGKDAERQRVDEDQQRHRHVEEGEDEQRRGERHVGAAGHGAVREEEADGVAAARGDDRVDAHAGEVGRRRSSIQRTGSSGYDAAIVFRHARLVHIVFSRWATIASASAVNLTSASCSKKTPIAWSTSPMRSGYSRYDRSAPSQPMNG